MWGLEECGWRVRGMWGGGVRGMWGLEECGGGVRGMWVGISGMAHVVEGL